VWSNASIKKKKHSEEARKGLNEKGCQLPTTAELDFETKIENLPADPALPYFPLSQPTFQPSFELSTAIIAKPPTSAKRTQQQHMPISKLASSLKLYECFHQPLAL